MGYRNRLSSATAVDTARGDLLRAAVRVVEGVDEFGRTNGRVEFRSGVLGDEPAVLELQSYSFLTDGVLRSFGSKFRLYGGKTNNTLGPYLDLDLVEPAVGGDPYQRVARLGADQAETTGRIALVPRSGTRLATPNAFRNNVPAGASWARWNQAGYQDLTFTQLPDGMIQVTGTVRYTGTAGLANPDLLIVTGAFVPSSLTGHAILSANVNDTRAGYADVRTDGLIRLRGAAPATNGFVSLHGTYHGRDF